MKRIFFIIVIALVAFTSCENDEWEFADYEYQSVYFAYQSPVRTITLGEGIYDTSLDNEHKCKIVAKMAGAYTNENDIEIDIDVNNSLVDGYLFSDGGDTIRAMPDNYYDLASDQILIPEGEVAGGVEVQLTDAFFNDPQSIENTYVIPLEMTGAQNVDSILSGSPLVDNPDKLNDSHWQDNPKDYILYAIKYINKWHGSYLRRGEDVVAGKAGSSFEDTTIVRHAKYVSKDEVVNLNTRSLNEVEFPLTVIDENNENRTINMLLTFDDEGSCTVSDESEDFSVSGSGEFVKDGDKNSWGNEDRDAIYLDYEIDFENIHYSTQDTLVIRDRGVTMETFSPVSAN